MPSGPTPWDPGTRVYVISSMLAPGSRADVKIVSPHAAVTLAQPLRHEPGDGEIWLFGGGRLFAALLAGGQVDRVEITVVPILLGGGVHVVSPIPERAPLKLIHTHVYPSGMVALHYEVPGATA